MSWNEIENKGTRNSESGDGKVDYVSLPVGTTRLRIRDEEPKSRWVHWIPQANGGKGTSVACTGKGCHVCKAMSEDKKAKRKTKYSATKSHAINVLTRSYKTMQGVETAINKPQVLDKGNKIFEGLLMIMKQMGDLRGYDILITRTGEELGSINYTVLPTFPAVPLTAEEEALPKFDLEAITTPFTAEQIEMFMNGATYEQVNSGTTPDSMPTDSQEAPSGLSVDFTQRA